MHAVKKLVQGLRTRFEEGTFAGFVDVHGHSRKKNFFLYGPRFPLHHTGYLRVRMIPRLLAERSDMFRYAACKFKNEKSKRKTARLVLAKEFGVVNSYTLESSFFGYIDGERGTRHFTTSRLEEIGA